jgi:hypothetical protein
MAQVNINDPRGSGYDNGSAYDDAAGARTAATNNLTWAIAVVLIVAAIVVAIVFLSHNLHF